MEYNFDKLAAFAKNKEHHANIDLDKFEKFKKFYDLLVEKNSETNLTNIVLLEEVETKHFIDSLVSIDLIKKYTDGINFSLIDIGCGAGFPGIPLKIYFDKAEFVLVDSIAKKIEFVNESIEVLELQNITTETERAEFLARTQYREHFDICTARAVASAPVLLEYCLPFLSLGGHCILYKSGSYEEEMDSAALALDILGGQVKEILEFTLPFTNAQRSLIVIEKIKATPDKYPRRPGKASKSPIGA